MTDAIPAPRERGWRRLVPALLAFVLVSETPYLRALVPIEQTVVLLVPALAACTIVGWWLGGRLSFAVVWTALAVWLLAHPVARGSAAFDAFVRGWSVLLAASFAAVLLAGTRRPMLGRALGAVALAFAAGAASLALAGRAPSAVGVVVRDQLVQRAEADMPASREGWRAMADIVIPGDTGATALASNRGEFMSAMEESTRETVRQAARIAPAVLAIESLVALALAWSLYHRFSRVRLGPPLSTLRAFRFNDQLVWGFIAGLMVLVLPAMAGWRGVGLNLVVLFGSLYALRGLGILAWLFNPRWPARVAFTLSAIPFWPVYAAGALAVGVGDTWIDWRARDRARPTS